MNTSGNSLLFKLQTHTALIKTSNSRENFLEEIPPSITTGNCTFQTVTWTGNTTINEPSDGLVPLSMQMIEGLPADRVYIAREVNHLEVANHPNITARFNDIWDRREGDPFRVAPR